MVKKQGLKIGLDFHGVITADPAYFKAFTDEAARAGHQIYIITGGPEKVIQDFLSSEGICCYKLFTILDYYAARGLVTFYPDGNFKMDDELWNSAKGKFCREFKIDIHIDNSQVYGKYFTTPYCLYDQQSKSCTLDNDVVVSLSLSPQEALAQIEKALAY